MRVLGCALVLLVTFTLGLSFAVPAEDLPETPYDESESLPYEMTPSLSGGLVEESAPTLQIVSIGPTDLLSTPGHALSQASRKDLAPYQIADSLILIHHSFRC